MYDFEVHVVALLPSHHYVCRMFLFFFHFMLTCKKFEILTQGCPICSQGRSRETLRTRLFVVGVDLFFLDCSILIKEKVSLFESSSSWDIFS